MKYSEQAQSGCWRSTNSVWKNFRSWKAWSRTFTGLLVLYSEHLCLNFYPTLSPYIDLFSQVDWSAPQKFDFQNETYLKGTLTWSTNEASPSSTPTTTWGNGWWMWETAFTLLVSNTLVRNQTVFTHFHSPYLLLTLLFRCEERSQWLGDETTMLSRRLKGYE